MAFGISFFRRYLKQQNIEALAVSIKAGVRYVTVYNATKGNPITPEHAHKIKQAVLNMTGIPFTGNLVLIEQLPPDQLPTVPIKRFVKSRLN
jgi:hypothetical protein